MIDIVLDNSVKALTCSCSCASVTGINYLITFLSCLIIDSGCSFVALFTSCDSIVLSHAVCQLSVVEQQMYAYVIKGY